MLCICVCGDVTLCVRFQGDIMAQQLKFIACLKIMMEELSTLATGFEVRSLLMVTSGSVVHFRLPLRSAQMCLFPS